MRSVLTTLKMVELATDAEAGDENSECGEADVTAQSAEGVAEILQKDCQGMAGCGCRGVALWPVPRRPT